jgi:hypothetical protein
MGRVACMLAGYPRMEIEGISNLEIREGWIGETLEVF